MRIIFPTLLIAIAIASFLLFTNPLWQEVRVLNAEKAAFNEALSSSKQFQTLRGELVSRFNSFSRADLERLSRMLPDNPDSIRLITQIERIASDHGFVINNIKFEEPQTATETRFVGETAAATRPYQVFTLEFSVGGGRYGDFVALLSDLESSLRLIDVNTLAFSAVARGTLPPGAPRDIYNYSFKIRTYWFGS
jgi:Tfp pilus assembly protein PilO